MNGDVGLAFKSSSGASHSTFCSYLAKQFMAKKGFEVSSLPETQQLARACDGILTYSDGRTLQIVCLVDREKNPGRPFELSPHQMRAIGEGCRTYRGSVRYPVKLTIIEVGPSDAGQYERLKPYKRTYLFSKIHLAAVVVDTTTHEVRSNTYRIWSPYRSFLTRLLNSPREPDEALVVPQIAVASPSFPILTSSIIAVLAGVFVIELVGPHIGVLESAIVTFIALGGVSRSLVVDGGEWFRLLSAPLLHLGPMHITLNAVAIFIAGRQLEWLIGRSWFAAIYAVSALCGSLASILANPPNILSVGASGAGMGLFAAMLVCSLHQRPGPIRAKLQRNALYVLIPSMLPLSSANIDYGAHFGGAAGGAAVAFLLLHIWPNTDIWPKWRGLAAFTAIAGLVALAWSTVALARNYSLRAEFEAQMIPSEKYPRMPQERASLAADLVAQYPRDPRARMARATQLFNAKDLAGAEREARAGLSEQSLWHSPALEPVEFQLRGLLAAAIMDHNREEAMNVARPVCSSRARRLRTFVNSQKLCES